jgi:hypothetical protein
MATFYSAYVLLLYAIRGSEPFDALGVSVGALVGAYYGTGILAGGIAGFCWPVAKTRIGATVLGIVCAFIAYAGVGVTMDGVPWQWTAREWSASITLGVLMGTAVANIWYRKPEAAVPVPAPSSLRTVRTQDPPEGS